MDKERKAAVEKQFDRDAGEYLSRHLTPEIMREKDRILDLVRAHTKYQRILDIGCGPGTISEDLLNIGENIWGIDISEDMIKIARERFSGNILSSQIQFSVDDVENLHFPDGYFDAVFGLGVLRFLDSWEKGLKEIYRVLKPNGVVAVTFYYRFSPHWFSMFFLYRPLLPLITLIKGRSFNDMVLKYKAEPLPFSYRKFRRIFTQIGFKHLETQHSGFDVFPLNRLFPSISRFFYLKAESVLYNSGKLGWLGSICIVKGSK